MKRAIVAMLAAAAIPALAETSADVLAWFVDVEDSTEGGQYAKFDEIKFWAVDSSNNKLGLGGLTYTSPEDLQAARYQDLAQAPTASSDPVVDGSFGYSDATVTRYYYTDLSGFQYDNGYSFLMELYNNGQKVDWTDGPLSLAVIQNASGLYSLGDLLENDLALNGGFDSFNFGGHMVPEPTSGMLLLAGGALLALRRRRR